MRGETGVCGPFCWVWELARAPATRLLLSLVGPPAPHARPPEVPGGLLERRDWTQAGVMWVSWRARGCTGIDSCDPSKRPPVSAPGRKEPRQTPKDGERAEAARVHLRLCASGSLASDAQLCPASSPRLALPIAVGRSVTVIFQHPGFPGSRGRRAAENSSLPPNRQLSKLSARPAAPPGRPARGFRTNTTTHTSMRAPPARPEPPNQT